MTAAWEVSDIGDRAALDDFDHGRPYWSHGEDVMYVEQPKRMNTVSLLLVNHQLQTETLDALCILPTKHSTSLM